MKTLESPSSHPTTPRRIRLSRAKGWRLPEGAVNCSRPGPLGNPFKVGRDGTREECVRLYRTLLSGLVVFGPGATTDEQVDALNYLVDHREELRGRDLSCWCALDGPCHAEVILKAVNS